MVHAHHEFDRGSAGEICAERADLQPRCGSENIRLAPAAGADGNSNDYDDFGIIHGITNHVRFHAASRFPALQNTNAPFADTNAYSNLVRMTFFN